MSNKSTVKAIVPVFQVADVAAAVAYYKETFGFGNEWVMGDIYGSASRDGQTIHFGKAAENAPTKIYLMVDGVEALHDEIAPKGLEIVSPLQTHDYGMRDFYVRDAFGNVLGFGQEMG